MPERELIDYIRALAAAERPDWLRLGIGDDCAVIAPPAGAPLVASTDMVVEGVHFEPGTAPELVGRKAMARGVSDIAAMAARPLCTLAAVCFGAGTDGDSAHRLVRSLYEAAREFGAPLVGGDVASGAGRLSITVTALGVAGPKGAVSRAGALAGDAACVTGSLGGSILGRHLRFTPRIRAALALADSFDLHAMIDISDGLSTDALHIAEASGHGVTLYADRLPVSDDARTLARRTAGRAPFEHALDDGEDYELLFCLPPEQARVLAQSGIEGLAVSAIGEVTEAPQSVLVMPGGRRVPLVPGGWEHKLR
jgi:thiamine-monophosphate kinase